MFPISEKDLDSVLSNHGIHDITTATIRQICAVSSDLEEIAGEGFVHLELGNPGMPPEEIGMEAERLAIRPGVVNRYPNVNGIPEIKDAGKRFVKAFMDVDVPEKCIVPTVGSMQGSFTLFMLLRQRIPGKDTILFIHPGFPAQWHQAKILGINAISFDIYANRGNRMREGLEEVLKSGRITAIIYSNPNNPAWTNLTETELQAIGELATKYDAVVVEDHAYMGMDFRQYAGHPGLPPYIPTVAKYTDNYALLISASKIFSYAGQRIAIVCLSPKVYERKYPVLEAFYEMKDFGDCYIYGVLYTVSSGTCHSAQHALAAMMDAACRGKLDFVSHCHEYADRCKVVKDIFRRNGFRLVYADDDGRDISDGFFFTASYGDMKGGDLQKELLRFGISTIALPCTGSKEEGIRVCVSTVGDHSSYSTLENRLNRFCNER